jgi:SAM-dependent methyltransferase
MILRTKDEETFTINLSTDSLDITEWEDCSRINEGAWKLRYDHEAKIISTMIKNFNYKSVLEIGSGPGALSQCVQNKLDYDIEYHLVDKPFAKEYFVKNNSKGTFFVKNVTMDLDTSDLNETYDLVICNDCMEHLFCPSVVLNRIRGLMKDTSRFFISVPNWRMGHTFIYRGLFDHDNFIYFCHTHGFEIERVYDSNLKCQYSDKLQTEETMPDNLINSWNIYYQCIPNNKKYSKINLESF